MTFNRPGFSLLLCTFVYLCAILSPQTLAAPEIRHFVPHAVVPGQRTVLTFSGNGLDKASNLWTSFGGTANRVANTNEGLISFAVTCPADASGIQALQLSSPEGASNFQLLMVDTLETSPHGENHQQPESALKIVPPAAVDCILKSEKIDYYRLRAKSGARFSIEVIAHRVGSQMDPVVRILNGSGHEIAFCDDDGGVWKDARFEFRAPADGDYTIAVHDVGYGGGNAYDYRLRVTTEPLIWFTFPLADPSLAGTPVEQVGVKTEAVQATSPANPSPALLLSPLPQLVESEPNNSSANAQFAGIPVILHGRIQDSADADYFRFEAAKDQKLIFQSQTRSAGSPCDLVLTLRKLDGSQLAQSDLSGAGDACVTNKFPEGGPFQLEVRELSGNAIPDAPYRIKVQQFAPGFSLSTDKNIINLKPGESTKVKITAARHDFNGPIQLRLESTLAGISLEEATIPEKKNEVELKIVAAETAKPGDLLHSKLIGFNTDDFTAPVSTRPALRETFPLMLNPPPALENLFVIAIRN